MIHAKNQTQLEVWIVNYISTYVVGEQLPPERELSYMFGAGRQKIREVMIKLCVKDIVAKSHGKPSVLTKDIFESEEHF